MIRFFLFELRISFCTSRESLSTGTCKYFSPDLSGDFKLTLMVLLCGLNAISMDSFVNSNDAPSETCAPESDRILRMMPTSIQSRCILPIHLQPCSDRLPDQFVPFTIAGTAKKSLLDLGGRMFTHSSFGPLFTLNILVDPSLPIASRPTETSYA